MAKSAKPEEIITKPLHREALASSGKCGLGGDADRIIPDGSSRYVLCTMCIGVGQVIASVVERI